MKLSMNFLPGACLSLAMAAAIPAVAGQSEFSGQFEADGQFRQIVDAIAWIDNFGSPSVAFTDRAFDRSSDRGVNHIVQMHEGATLRLILDRNTGRLQVFSVDIRSQGGLVSNSGARPGEALELSRFDAERIVGQYTHTSGEPIRFDLPIHQE